MRCVDSLPIFREIDRLQSLSVLTHDDDDLIPMPPDEIEEQEPNSSSMSTPHVSDTESVALSPTKSAYETETTVPPLDSTFDWQKANETTPTSRVILKAKAPIKALEAKLTPKTQVTPTSLEKPSLLFKRKLFDAAKSPNISKKKYTLCDVYERLHGKIPAVAHFAEADTMALLFCARTLGDEFIELAERYSRFFSDVKELGTS